MNVPTRQIPLALFYIQLIACTRRGTVASYEPEAKLFRILGNPARLDLLDCLSAGEACVCHLEALLGMRQAYLSQHLAVLRQAGLVQGRRQGLNIYYRLAEPRLLLVLEAAHALTRHSRLTRRPPATSVPDCPCPKCSQAAAAHPRNSQS
jgi:DNA-binding transcriptional ArsR family regulator